MTVSEELVAFDGPQATPYSYVLPPDLALTPSVVNATFDGTAAAGAFLPCCSIYSQDGRLLSRTFPGSVPTGDTAEVTFAPFLRPLVAGSAPSSTGAFTGGSTGAITAVGAGTNRTDSRNNSATANGFVTLPAGIVAGDLMIAAFATYQATVPFGDISLISVPAGWSTLYAYQIIVQDDGGNAGSKSVQAAFYRVATGAESGTAGPWVFGNAAVGGTRVDTVCRAYRGVSVSNSGLFYGKQTSIGGNSPYTVTSPSVPTVPSGAVAVLLVTCPAIVAAGTWTMPAGFTNVASQAGFSGTIDAFIAEQNPATSAPAETLTMTSSNNLGLANRFCVVVQLVLFPTVA